MMRAFTPIVALAATPAAALTPLPPPCAYSGDLAERREIINAAPHGNRFVSYITTDRSDREWLYLEHCPSGQILRVRSARGSVAPGNPRNPDRIRETVFGVLASERRYSMGDIQALLRNGGVAAKRYTSGAESCACHQNFPDAVGSKTPYKKDTK